MALLRLTNGRVYTAVDDINAIVSPLRIGTFDLPRSVADAVKRFSHPLSHDDAMYVLDHFDPAAKAMVEAEGFNYQRLGNVVPSPTGDGTFAFVQRHRAGDPTAPPTARSAQDIANYLIPHYVQVNDWHFIFSGAIVKGVQLEDGLQGVVYCQAGDWIRLGPAILNWPIFPYGEATAAISCFDRPFDSPFKMDLRPEVQVHPAALY